MDGLTDITTCRNASTLRMVEYNLYQDHYPTLSLAVTYLDERLAKLNLAFTMYAGLTRDSTVCGFMFYQKTAKKK